MADEEIADVAAQASPDDSVAIVNTTDLPDEDVEEAVLDYFVEHAAFNWDRGDTRFQNYLSNGNLMARREFRSPGSIQEEIELARELAERDDDVSATMGMMIAAAFSEGMENFHEDERTVGLFNAAAREMNLDSVLKDMYREYLISSQLITVSLFTRTQLSWTNSSGKTVEESVVVPAVGVLPSERVRVIGDDTFHTAELAYQPDDQRLKEWLRAYFDPKTSPAKKAELGRQNRVAAHMFTGRVSAKDIASPLDPYAVVDEDLYLLNPRVVHRSTMPKGSWDYPRPLLTRNFPLLEAKRLLNILDFSLLQGGANFVIVVKKGSDERPATPKELKNLNNVVRAASKTGVVLGDHRLNFEIITPDLSELLNAEKRDMIGAKLAAAVRRAPNPDSEGEDSSSADLTARVITADRMDIKRHVERTFYDEMVRRNPSIFTDGAPKLWFPKVILSDSSDYLTNYVLKLRDRGDIPRKWAVEAAGFDYEAGVRQRQREIDAGDDEIMHPGEVPFSSPDMGPQDTQQGRPSGGRDDRDRRQITRTPGETVRAWYEEELSQTVRCGDITLSLLEQYPDYTKGRVSAQQREIMEEGEILTRGGAVYAPVNHEISVENIQSIKLSDDLSMLVGERKGDGAFLAKLFVFRDSKWSAEQAQETLSRWGYPIVD